MDKAQWEQHSYLAGNNAAYVEDLYEAYLANPNSVEPKWQQYFSSLKDSSASVDVSHAAIREGFRERARHPRMQAAAAAPQQDQSEQAIIDAYRRYGHYSAHVNPLEDCPALDSHLSGGDSALEKRMRETYCGSIGFEYAYIDDDAERAWLADRIENILPTKKISVERQKEILWQLVSADTFEKYLDVKHVGQKRFSVEGLDSMIPMLRALSESASDVGMKEVVVAMAHRGRLNVILNVMGRSSGDVLSEFEGKNSEGMTSGDVKYHLGFSSDVATKTGTVHLSLMFNPSHLEFINPAAMGSARARQDKYGGDAPFDYAMPVIVHGDAAFAGQGIVMETLSMSKTPAYRVGGSLHIIANNQIGFTTSNPEDARSSHYCSDLGKMISAPIFHVNTDDVEASIRVLELAFEYRMHFHKDVIIDLVGYRRHGHQEVDEPRATQPLMYQKIKARPSAARIYANKLVAAGVVTDTDYLNMVEEYRGLLDAGKTTIKTERGGLADQHEALWSKHVKAQYNAEHDTQLSVDLIESLGKALVDLPEGAVLHKNVNKIATSRAKMAMGEMPMDWGFAEMLSYASLLHAKYDVRLTGEDVRRGTFYHRHARFVHQDTDESITPLDKVAADNGTHFSIYDSLLSESGTMGFEYGYSTADPESLVIWEAQFGDFANGAQVIIDQFISSGWQKWTRLSGLVLLLPHGYEGMGPEHSSARLERYLQLCAQDNIQVCVPSTPAQIFHLLRRQVMRHYRKPLIVLTPKSLLRHKLAVSTIADLADNTFQTVLPEIDDINPGKVTQLILCSGKVYYELLEKRREMGREDIAILRLEQQYPFPYDKFQEQLDQYPNLNSIIWCQEEPKNQGAWFWVRDRFAKVLQGTDVTLSYAGRDAQAAPACGYASRHRNEQVALVARALSNDFSVKDTIKF